MTRDEMRAAALSDWANTAFEARENWTRDPHEHIERLVTAGDAAIAALSAPADPRQVQIAVQQAVALWRAEMYPHIAPDPRTIDSNLVGRHVSWNDGHYKAGPVMAVYIGNCGRPTLLVLVDGKLVAKDAEGVYVQ